MSIDLDNGCSMKYNCYQDTTYLTASVHLNLASYIHCIYHGSFYSKCYLNVIYYVITIYITLVIYIYEIYLNGIIIALPSTRLINFKLSMKEKIISQCIISIKELILYSI